MINHLNTDNKLVSPVIGVVGGGQLAQMMVDAASKRNVNVIVQTGSSEDPAAKKAYKVIFADPVDASATKNLVENTNGVTFENEWIDVKQLLLLEKQYHNFQPSISSLELLVDKINQRKLLKELDILGPDWVALRDLKITNKRLPNDWTFPVMAKLSNGGYDGKGNKVINNIKELEKLLNSEECDRWFIEKWVPYQKELAIVVSRDRSGRVRSFPLVETCQKNQICDWVIAPAAVHSSVEVTAYNIAASLVTKLNYEGVLAVEFFYGIQGLMVNEIAPRTHNSAHFSIEACTSSQFDQQICITADLPVPSPELIAPGALMVNLLGLSNKFEVSIEDRIDMLQRHEKFSIHWYGKEKETPGRKLGHVTVLLEGKDFISRKDEADRALSLIRSIWPTSFDG